MPDFTIVEDTLFVPMLGRIYASEQFPHLLYDQKALELKQKLPQNIKGQETQTQYTLLASAVRSSNMDRYISRFLEKHQEGVVVELGCGLETAFYRNDQGKASWYEIDLPAVIAYREQLLYGEKRDQTIAADAFGEDWIRQIRSEHPTDPLLITASGLFYYFERDKVLKLLQTFQHYGEIEIVFDTVNAKGMKRIGHYMKQVGHAEAAVYFYVDSGEELAQKTGGRLLAEEPYYAHTDKKGLQFMTSVSMRVSDRFQMVKMIHLQFNGVDQPDLQ